MGAIASWCYADLNLASGLLGKPIVVRSLLPGFRFTMYHYATIL